MTGSSSSPDIEQWIEREFAGYGVAIRCKEDDPFPGEPFMSMAEAKDLTRRAVAEFATGRQCSAGTGRDLQAIYNDLLELQGQTDHVPLTIALDAVGAALNVAQRAPKWPEPKVTNPDIAAPTGNAYINCLIHRVLDAQQDINHHANEGMSQSLCDAAALLDEVETALRTAASSLPSTEGK